MVKDLRATLAGTARRSSRYDPKRSANRIATYGLSGWIRIQDTPDELKQWRGAIQELLPRVTRGSD